MGRRASASFDAPQSTRVLGCLACLFFRRLTTTVAYSASCPESLLELLSLTWSLIVILHLSFPLGTCRCLRFGLAKFHSVAWVHLCFASLFVPLSSDFAFSSWTSDYVVIPELECPLEKFPKFPVVVSGNLRGVQIQLLSSTDPGRNFDCLRPCLRSFLMPLLSKQSND